MLGFLEEQSDNVWELLGQERRSDDLMVDGGTVNLYELEKRRMRED